MPPKLPHVPTAVSLHGSMGPTSACVDGRPCRGGVCADGYLACTDASLARWYCADGHNVCRRPAAVGPLPACCSVIRSELLKPYVHVLYAGRMVVPSSTNPIW
jgi:hypothetical protein